MPNDWGHLLPGNLAFHLENLAHKFAEEMQALDRVDVMVLPGSHSISPAVILARHILVVTAQEAIELLKNISACADIVKDTLTSREEVATALLLAMDKWCYPTLTILFDGINIHEVVFTNHLCKLDSVLNRLDDLLLNTLAADSVTSPAMRAMTLSEILVPIIFPIANLYSDTEGESPVMNLLGLSYETFTTPLCNLFAPPPGDNPDQIVTPDAVAGVISRELVSRIVAYRRVITQVAGNIILYISELEMVVTEQRLLYQRLLETGFQDIGVTRCEVIDEWVKVRRAAEAALGAVSG